MALTPLTEVQDEIRAVIGILPAVAVPLHRASGLVLAEDVVATEASPPFENSAMDGYAVRAADTVGASVAAPVRLRVVDDLAAGRAPTVAVGPGEAIRIMTGAVLPEGADAVVIVERTRRDGSGVLVEAAATSGDHRRPAGGDVRPGDLVLHAGGRLHPAAIGVAAALGLETLRAVPRVRVGVFSTGDELQAGPAALAVGQIRDSNRPMLCALVEAAGGVAVDLGIARDDESAITALLEDAFSTCDAVITSGGVSMGDYDFVKLVLERMGVLRWRQVAIKPAKPLAFGLVDRVPVFGLPGNPVSALVSFELFARPSLRRMMAYPDPERPRLRAIVGEDMPRRSDGKLHLDRVTLDDRGSHLVAARVGPQASNALAALAAADGLALLPDGVGVGAGEPVDVLPLDGFALAGPH